MIATLSPIQDQFIIFYFEMKRRFYQWRHPNLHLAPGVKIKHQLLIGGDVQVTIGSGSRLGKRVCIYGKGTVTIGKNVLVNGSYIGCETSVTIGDDCLLSDCFLADSDYHNLQPHLRHAPAGPKVSAPIVLERNVWIGARANILKGVTIGENSVIGLGSVVRKSIPPNVVVIGNPAQIVKHFAPEHPTDLRETPEATPDRTSVYSG
jgi:acetyltransferase-like isoleucine patch superfamily enzyme